MRELEKSNKQLKQQIAEMEEENCKTREVNARMDKEIARMDKETDDDEPLHPPLHFVFVAEDNVQGRLHPVLVSSISPSGRRSEVESMWKTNTQDTKPTGDIVKAKNKPEDVQAKSKTPPPAEQQIELRMKTHAEPQATPANGHLSLSLRHHHKPII